MAMLNSLHCFLRMHWYVFACGGWLCFPSACKCCRLQGDAAWNLLSVNIVQIMSSSSSPACLSDAWAFGILLKRQDHDGSGWQCECKGREHLRHLGSHQQPIWKFVEGDSVPAPSVQHCPVASASVVHSKPYALECIQPMICGLQVSVADIHVSDL